MNQMICLRQSVLLRGVILAILAIQATQPAHGATLIVGDNYNVTTTSTGFNVNKGVNYGINPPATRLTGTAVANLRYLHTNPTKPPGQYGITANKLTVAEDPGTGTSGRFTLSADGSNPLNFSEVLGTEAATPANPVIYDIAIKMINTASSIARFSFGFGTVEGNVDVWDFGVQLWRTNSNTTRYMIQKRIDKDSSGLAADLNEHMYRMAADTYGTEVSFLIRVTDAGAETTAFSSRVQVSLNGGSSWIYDTTTDTDLPNGWRFDGATRYFIWDQAPLTGTGVFVYDDFSVTDYDPTWDGGGSGDEWYRSGNWGGRQLPYTNGLHGVIFAGSTRLTPLMQDSYTVRKVQFNSGAGSFTIGAAEGMTLTLTGDILQYAANAQTLNTPMAIAATRTVDTATGNLTIGGAISGAGGIAKSGDYTLTLSGANTYSGNTTVSDGTLLISGSIGSGAVSVASGATLGGAGTIGGNVTVQSDATLAPGATIGSIGSLTISGSKNVTLASNSKTAVEINRAAPSSDLLAGIGTLTMGGTLEVANTGTALAAGDTFTLFSAGTYSGEFAALSPSAPDSNAHLSWDFPALKNTGVLAVHYAPVAPSAAKLITTSQNTPAAIYKAKLLAGASDADGHPLTVSAASSPSEQGGAVEVQADQVIYTPPTGFTGPDRFSYTISDGHGGTAVGTVNVTVTDIGGMSPNIVSGPTYANGVFSVTFAGIPNVNYTVEYTTAMPPSSGWIKLNNVTAAGNGLFVVEDIIGQAPSRFYRTVHPAYE